MPTVTQSDNPDNSASSSILEMDEFLPIVKFKNPSSYPERYGTLVQSDEEVELSEYLDEDKKTFKILSLNTELKQLRLTFTIAKGGSKSEDDDGFLDISLSSQDESVKLSSPAQMKVKYGDEIDVDLEWDGKENKEFYIDFHANDDEDDFNVGEYENVHCGRVKVIFEGPNEWEFSVEKIQEVRSYAILNNADYSGPGDRNRYHHCTDTHKHIIYKLLDNPTDLILGKDQNHMADRLTPNDFTRAGESTTHGIRKAMITSTYAESSETFTVIDILGREVLTSGNTPGNTDKTLNGFKKSPVAYMKSRCPDDGYYVFIGAYNDDYHSFTVLVKKEGEAFDFQFVDQMVGVENHPENGFEKNKLLKNIYEYGFDFPMKLELFQVRNKKK